MVFSSTLFLFYFLPLFLGLYYLTPRRGRAVTLTLASYLFYGWWRPDFVILMWVSTLVDFHAGGRIQAARERAGLSPGDPAGAGRPGKFWVTLSCVVNLGLLGYFKYANFTVESLNWLLSRSGEAPIFWTQVVLPVGISFYTFQTMSYTIDLYRGVARPAERLIDFAAYVSLFPQLVAGPIVRYNSVAEQLRERSHTLDKFFRGVLFFQAGFAKKILIADPLGQVADRAFGDATLGALDAWLGLLAYAFQIYFDFSGYSDMAIGLGLMIGFRFPINFDQPYRSVSITDFWRRWHISLSTWLRDYLYLPLGGNRRGPTRTYVNLALVMLLGGLWHGASWTFVAWGAYQGFWLVVERAFGKKPLYAALPRILRVALTFVLVLGGWVLFRAETIGDAGQYFLQLFGTVDAPDERLFIRPFHWIVFAVGSALLWLFPTTQVQVARARTPYVLALQPIFWIAVLHLLNADHVPFLYFQF